MSLAYDVLSYIQRARRAPVDASDPRVLEALERAARRSFDGAWVARQQPIAPLTWEVQAPLLGANPETARVALEFPRPVELVGLAATVEVTAAGGTVPTLDNIAVAIDLNNQERITSAQGITAGAGGVNGTFVTLSSMTNDKRLLGLKCDVAKPNVGFSFRWKRGAGVFQNSLITVAVFARYLD